MKYWVLKNWAFLELCILWVYNFFDSAKKWYCVSCVSVRSFMKYSHWSLGYCACHWSAINSLFNLCRWFAHGCKRGFMWQWKRANSARGSPYCDYCWWIFKTVCTLITFRDAIFILYFYKNLVYKLIFLHCIYSYFDDVMLKVLFQILPAHKSFWLLGRWIWVVGEHLRRTFSMLFDTLHQMYLVATLKR